MKRYALQVLIAFDQLLCALIGGWADESLSSYAYRLERDGKFWGRVWRPLTDWVFWVLFAEERHCFNAYLSERRRAQSPPEMRF
jgi:hypothetical protein